MAITYNPYGWVIRKRKDKKKEDTSHKIKTIIEEKEEQRNRLIEELYEYRNCHHGSVSDMIMAILLLQIEINELWKDSGLYDEKLSMDFIRYLSKDVI